MDCSPPVLCPGNNTGVGCHSLLQRIFLDQGSNSCLLHWQVDSLPMDRQGSPFSEGTDSQLGWFWPPGDVVSIWKYLWPSQWQALHWHLPGSDQECCWTSYSTQRGPPLVTENFLSPPPPPPTKCHQCGCPYPKVKLSWTEGDKSVKGLSQVPFDLSESIFKNLFKNYV